MLARSLPVIRRCSRWPSRPIWANPTPESRRDGPSTMRARPDAARGECRADEWRAQSLTEGGQMRRSSLMFAAAVLATVFAASGAVGAQLNFGGDLGFVLFDVSSGNGIQPSRDSLGNAVPKPYGDTTGRINTYLESHGLGLYWNVQLTDQVSVNALTEVGGTTTGASPSLGKKLGTQQGGAGTQKPLSVPEANITVMLPWELQMTTGIIRPVFSEDYGEKKSYQESNRMSKSSANGYGGEWHDLGVEFYKSFEPGGGVSIPAYGYLLAGEQMYG